MKFNSKKAYLKICRTFSFAALFLFSVVSCASTDETQIAYTAINYTQEDVVADEIKNIESMMEKKPVEALWRAHVLVTNAPEISGTAEVFEKCQDSVSNLYSKNLEEKKYVEAKRIYESLVAVDSKRVNEKSRDLENIVSSINTSIPLEKTVNQNQKVSTMINGTVTVYVDKGVKVEDGIGFNDTVLGSGFFITKNGYIVTNHHVIADCVDPKYKGYAKLYIKLAEDSDTKIPARVVGYDKTMDLALLKTEVDAPYVFTLGSSSDLEIGDRIFVIGSPLGLERTLTSGIVSATDRDLLSLGKVFQLDAAVSPGNSGGPMIDDQGRVQAVVFAGVQNYQGLNFAIPVEYLKAELVYLFQGGKRVHPWFEAFGKTKRMAGSGAKNEGVEILYTMNGGKMCFSGIKEGEVVVKVDDTPISSVDDLHLYLLGREGDSIVKVTTESFNEKNSEPVLKTYSVYLAQRPENPGYSFYSSDLLSSVLYPVVGMELVRSSTSNKRLYSVKRVLKGSAADQSGFSVGDPVQVLTSELMEDKSILHVEIYAKKKRNGYLDYGMSLAVPLDGSLYL